jgi:hypothetical protein
MLLVLILLTVIYAVFDMVELGTLSSLSFGELMTAYLLKVPSLLSQLLPLALVIGVALNIAALKTSGEWDALAAMGLSPTAVAGRLLIPAVIGTALSLLLVGYIAPYFLNQAEAKTRSERTPNGKWVRRDGWMIKVDEAGGVMAAIGLPIDKTLPERYDRYKTEIDSNGWKRWRPDTGWEEIASGMPEGPDLSGFSSIQSPLGALPGATLSMSALSRTIAALRRLGLSAAPLEAEQALRIVLTIATLLIPIATLGFNICFGDGEATQLVGQAIALSIGYWIVTAVLWNGVTTGVWSSIYLIVCAPVLFLLFSFSLLLILAGHRSGYRIGRRTVKVEP